MITYFDDYGPLVIMLDWFFEVKDLCEQSESFYNIESLKYNTSGRKELLVTYRKAEKDLREAIHDRKRNDNSNPSPSL